MHKHTPSKKKGIARFFDFLFNSNKLCNKQNGACACSICGKKLEFSPSYYFGSGALTVSIALLSFYFSFIIVAEIVARFEFVSIVGIILLILFCLVIAYLMKKILNALILTLPYGEVFIQDKKSLDGESEIIVNEAKRISNGIKAEIAIIWLILIFLL